MSDDQARAANAALQERLRVVEAELERLRRRQPNDEGGHGREETYWLRAKLDAAVTHLRDIEDYYRLKGGLGGSYNQVRADRARQLYEAILADFTNGKMNRPTLRERAEAAEAGLAAAREALREFDGTGMTGWEDCACFHCGRYRMLMSALAALVPDTERAEQ